MTKRGRTAAVALTLLVLTAGCAPARRAVPPATTPPRLAAWPEDPCGVLTAAQVGAVTGLEVTGARRTPNIVKLVDAQREGREPGPGRFICAYQTTSEFGDITIIVPPPGERSGTSYRAARDEYLSRFAARRVSGFGQDAWFAGGSTVTVLVRDDLYFVVATQMAQPRSQAIVVAVARAVLARLGE